MFSFFCYKVFMRKLCWQMSMSQQSASVFQVHRPSHNIVSPHCQSFLSFPPIHSPFHPNQSSSLCIRTQTNCQRAKPINLLTDYNDGEMEEVGGFKDDGKNYDKDPELAEILGNCLDDPDKAKSRLEERLRKKRNKIVHTKTGSATPMEVKFNKFDFTNTYIWFEFYNALLEKDISFICDTIRSWHIVGRLGGCNSLNMQLSQSLLDKRPSYDVVQGANVTPTTFYNIGDLEIQDNLARIWVDIGTSEPLLLDVLINALSQMSSDYVGIKQVVFGGSEFENWKENLTSEDAGYSVHKI
ncbi:hypothetical protein RND71_039730 [Anisodus tanguticus]|uniref:Uncharacterized protein n=1 Tax=Anisodus tanguticus TaxID=243964 RepID=A0AAE1UXV5_9SOLA|nr:hypothetical protein RND71_039730 [Anisodus tanguticus]